LKDINCGELLPDEENIETDRNERDEEIKLNPLKNITLKMSSFGSETMKNGRDGTTTES
jgi:hypothetical protein